jgi:hypothetical protein
MPTAIEFSKYAEIALAAYRTIFTPGDISTDSLVTSDAFTTSQANMFRNNWTVATPSYSDPISDFQATLFQEKLPGGGGGKAKKGARPN